MFLKIEIKDFAAVYLTIVFRNEHMSKWNYK